LTDSSKESLMRRLLVCLLLLCLPLAAVHAQSAPEETAQAFLDLLLDDNYDAAFALFNAELQSIVPQTRLLEVWSSILFYGGTFQEISGIRVEGDTATVTAQFERGAYDILVSVDANGQIYRLFFSPAVPGQPAIDPTAPAPEPTLPRLSRGYDPIGTLPTPSVTAPTDAAAQAAPEVEVPETGGRAGDPAELPPQPVEVVPGLEFAAASLIETLAREDYEVAIGQFNAELQTALPAAQLESAWNAVATEAGGYRMILIVRADDTTRTVVVTIQFENALIDALLAFDENGQLYSLYFVPSSGEGTTFENFGG
jgi:hypothetical protein